MDVTELSERDRGILLDALKRYRIHGEESSEVDFSHRDALEQKLHSGGILDDLDLYMCRIVIVNERPEMRGYFDQVIGEL